MGRAAVLACVMLGVSLAGSVAAELGPGTTLGPDTAEQAKGLLPEEILARYRRGEFVHEIAEPRPGTQWNDPGFTAAGPKNRGHFAVNDAGTIIDKATGKQPTYLYGPPFPDFDPADPQAAIKVVWNYFYNSYVLGDDRNLVALSWVGRRGLDRQSSTEVWQRFFDGQPEGRPHPANPNNLLFQQFVVTQSPADLQGTVSITWRYRDTKRDNTWAYVPALRRVRAVSPTNRSDGFLGSDMSQDDGGYFDGKPEDFVWKYVGEGETLCMADRGAVVDGRHDIRAVPGGGWRAVFPDKPRFAWQASGPAASLVPWAPLPDRVVLVRRPVHVIEATPRDKYYLYGKLVLGIERDNFNGCYNTKYDWRGDVLNVYSPLRGVWFQAGDGTGPWRPYSEAQFTLAQNLKLDRATASYPYANTPSNPADSLIPIEANLFDYQMMMQRGK